MSTRQHRLQSQEQIRKRIPELIGKEINIVLRDSTVLLGRLLEASDARLKVQNLRQKSFEIPLDKISEMYFDTKE